jgi:Tol biopolymer transport system component
MEWAPAWAGTGDRIAFQTNPGSIPTVCLADGSGGNVGCLQSGQTGSGHPALSPDGTQMAYISNEDGDWDIFIVDVANLGAPRKLTDNGQVDQHPRFSPDGQTILFQSNPYSTFDLFTMRTDGSELTQLTFSVEDEVDGEWVGSDRIVYSGLQGADYELMMMDRDGQNQVRLTDSEGMDGGPAWCAAN